MTIRVDTHEPFEGIIHGPNRWGEKEALWPRQEMCWLRYLTLFCKANLSPRRKRLYLTAYKRRRKTTVERKNIGSRYSLIFSSICNDFFWTTVVRIFFFVLDLSPAALSRVAAASRLIWGLTSPRNKGRREGAGSGTMRWVFNNFNLNLHKWFWIYHRTKKLLVIFWLSDAIYSEADFHIPHKCALYVSPDIPFPFWS